MRAADIQSQFWTGASLFSFRYWVTLAWRVASTQVVFTPGMFWLFSVLQSSRPCARPRCVAPHTVARASFTAWLSVGRRMPMSSAMMPTTTSSSISVNARLVD